MVSKSAAAPTQLLHETVRRTILDRIGNGMYSADRPLPGVLPLARELGVSAITVRRALSDLRASGAVRTAPGVGTFVNPTRRFLRHLHLLNDPLYGTLDDAERLGRKVSIVSRGTELRNPEDQAYRVFDLKKSRYFCIKKIILVDEIPVSYDETFVTFPLRQDLLAEFSGDLIYQVLRRRKVAVQRIRMYLDAAPATGAAASELGLPEGYPTIRHLYNPVVTDGSMQICGAAVSPFDKLGFVLEL